MYDDRCTALFAIVTIECRIKIVEKLLGLSFFLFFVHNLLLLLWLSFQFIIGPSFCNILSERVTWGVDVATFANGCFLFLLFFDFLNCISLCWCRWRLIDNLVKDLEACARLCNRGLRRLFGSSSSFDRTFLCTCVDLGFLGDGHLRSINTALEDGTLCSLSNSRMCLALSLESATFHCLVNFNSVVRLAFGVTSRGQNLLRYLILLVLYLFRFDLHILFFLCSLNVCFNMLHIYFLASSHLLSAHFCIQHRLVDRF